MIKNKDSSKTNYQGVGRGQKLSKTSNSSLITKKNQRNQILINRSGNKRWGRDYMVKNKLNSLFKLNFQ